MQSKIRLGVVGCARILPAHLQGLRLLRERGYDRFAITALVARKAEDALMFRQRGEGPPPRPSTITYATHDPLNAPHHYVSDVQEGPRPEVFTDYHQMIESKTVDAVINLTPLYLHHTVTLDCLAAGIHVLVEKPLAITVRAARRMVDEAAKRRLQLGTAEVLRYYPNVRHLKYALESGLIGRPQLWLSGGIGSKDWSPDRMVAETAWRHKKLLAGGGPALDGAVHVFDEIRYLLGEFDEVSARTTRLEPTRHLYERVDGKTTQTILGSVESEVEDTFFAHFRLKSGIIGSVMGGSSGHGEPTGFDGGNALYGSKGVIKDDRAILDGERSVDLAEHYDRQASIVLREHDFPLGLANGFSLELYDFLRSIETGRPMETDGLEGAKSLAVSFALFESASLNRPVAVDDVFEGRVESYAEELNRHYGLS